jgi:hypothetical protein
MAIVPSSTNRSAEPARSDHPVRSTRMVETGKKTDETAVVLRRQDAHLSAFEIIARNWSEKNKKKGYWFCQLL